MIKRPNNKSECSSIKLESVNKLKYWCNFFIPPKHIKYHIYFLYRIISLKYFPLKKANMSVCNFFNRFFSTGLSTRFFLICRIEWKSELTQKIVFCSMKENIISTIMDLKNFSFQNKLLQRKTILKLLTENCKTNEYCSILLEEKNHLHE